MEENNSEIVYEKYLKYINPSLARLMKVSGCANLESEALGCAIYDNLDNRYLDCLGGYGVFNFGHRHPRIVNAVINQLNKMPLSAKIFLNEPLSMAAEMLAKLTPGDLQYSFFGNSGTEAVEGALKLARLYTKKPHIIATYNGYHGKTFGSLSVTGRELFRTPFEPLLPEVTIIPFADHQALEQAITPYTSAFIVEPLQGEGGVIVPPAGYMTAIREITRKKGVLLIVDEIQTGMGRLGYNFACEEEGIDPDILVLAKALGGGVMPIGVFLGTPEVWKAFEPVPLIHTSTFGGNPLAATAALTALQVLVEENLAEKSRVSGKMLKEELQKTAAEFSIIKEVRGKGLLLGVEFIDAGYAGSTMMKMVDNGVIVAYTLNNPKVIRIEPPLIISQEEIKQVSRVFYQAVSETKKLLGG